MCLAKADLLELYQARFEPHGRGPAGYDCYGIYLEVNRRMGRTLPDVGSVAPDNYQAVHDQVNGHRSLYRKREAGEPHEPGDLVLFYGVRPFCQHLGVIVSRGRFMHMSVGTSGVHISSLTHPLWRESIEGIYEYRGE